MIVLEYSGDLCSICWKVICHWVDQIGLIVPEESFVVTKNRTQSQNLSKGAATEVPFGIFGPRMHNVDMDAQWALLIAYPKTHKTVPLIAVQDDTTFTLPAWKKIYSLNCKSHLFSVWDRSSFNRFEEGERKRVRLVRLRLCDEMLSVTLKYSFWWSVFFIMVDVFSM